MRTRIPYLLSRYLPAVGITPTSKRKRFAQTFLKFTFALCGLLFLPAVAMTQLGVYNFTGTGACPNQNPAVTTQPANATFSNYSSTGVTCVSANNVWRAESWNTTATINTAEYNEFTLTPNANYALTLTSISFTQYANEVPGGGTTWVLRSSIDGYAADIATGTVTTTSQTPTITLPAASFTHIGAVTFRFYILTARRNSTDWTNDAVTVNGTVDLWPPDPPNPTSNSPQCNPPGVTLTRSGSPPSDVTWYWQTSAGGTSTANSGSTYVATTSGTYYIRARNNNTGTWSVGAGSLAVTITPNVTTPVFTLGATSTRCQGAGNVTYTATASNTTGITYSLDGTSIAGGNSINTSTGEVTYVAGWSGTSVITASAAGCNGPVTANHTVTVTPTVGTPVFTLGAGSTRCQGAGNVTYTATASNSTAISYSLDATSLGAGNTINAATGEVTYTAGWTGTSTITATATGCNGPSTANHTVTINPSVTTPVFTTGATSTRCQGAGNVTYTATASNTTGITYTLDAPSLAGGNTINAATGEVTYAAGWSGTSIVTASAAGCNGPLTATHTVTVTPTVGTPVFTLGATSSRCIGAGSVTYTASATNNTGITYSLDPASITGGNSINAATGEVTYAAGWSGTSVITASATGCNGPSTADHTVSINLPVTTPVFTLGATSTRCQGAGNVTYTATASHTTGITYTLDGPSLAGGNTINASTGEVTYAAGWSGTTIITASAAGCFGPATAIHTVTITPTVGTPVFTLGATSTRCEGAGNTTYTANATNSTGISYSLDATSLAGGNTINATTGEVTYDAAWSGTSVITASAAGCNGPSTATHTVTITPTVGTPVFTLGASSNRCQGAGVVTYTATATDNTGITYSLDASSLAGGNTINAATGAVTFTAGWVGTSVVTATATGCNGPSTANHTITVDPSVETPVFGLGAASTRCQGAGNVTYMATASNTTGITYSLDAPSLAGGNTINATTGEVTYAAGWSGTSVITASAAGCSGPLTANHTVTITPTVGTPVFTLGATSSRCEAAGSVTYTANATNTTGITYTLDAASITGGNSINAATGEVTYVAGWSGTSIITASAAGCNGPSTATHTVTINPSVGTPSFTSGATSTRCQGAGSVTYSASATNTTGITYSLDAPSLAAGNTINAATGEVTYAAGWSGTSVITASAAGCAGPATSIHTVTITATVGTPVFTLGATSTRCQGAGTVTYDATASNSTGITYSLDAPSLAGGNTINAATGEVTYAAGWSGTSIITASATGCNGPSTATHTVTITPTVGTPVFTLGATSTRCQGAGNVTYTANATNATGITYTLDATSLAGGNSINAATGQVSYAAGWSGTSTITATAAGCNGPSTADHTVTITPIVTTPLFTLGATSTRCQGAGNVTYTATASNTTGITYSLDAPSLAGGNTINATTGEVTFAAGWSGTSVITASAAGCSGPLTANHTVTITPTVGTPVFTLGATSSRCEAAGSVTYTANATNTTGITYTLDAASITGGNSINAATGEVTYVAGWSGTSIITASAAGCNGPSTATHTVTINPSVGTPSFTLGATSTRCQGAGSVTYSASATNTTGITYSLDAPSLAAGNTINAGTGAVTYVAGWTGTSVITASAAGCSGPATATHTVTITPTVGLPSFIPGATSTRCQGAGNVTYTANATNTTGITYTLDAPSLAGGNSINATTGEVTYAAGWTGTTVITASAAGCAGPRTANHTVTITPTVGTPVFTLGATSTRCQGNGNVTYTANASNSTGLTYSLDAASLAGGLTINSSSGQVNYTAGWSGTTIITASAAGCNGPVTATHTVTVNGTVAVPLFALGASSTRCLGAATINYGATATNSTGITYSLDFASTLAGNTINAATGDVTFTALWVGTSTITASAAGCGGPRTATHTVTVTGAVGTPVFTLGASSARCVAAGTVTYTATAVNSSSITYSLDATSLAGGNTINSSTGAVTYTAGWTGTSVITATAAGCNGPTTANHTVTINDNVTTPVFTLGATSTRCQGAGSVTYTATASNTTGITYSLNAPALAAGNTINSATGAVTYVAGWTGATTITASAAGCSGPLTATHTVTITPTVGLPSFTLGATSTRCQGAGTVTYTATATNTTGITYSLDAPSLAGGNTINSSTGEVTYAAGWSGSSIITASAAGCGGPRTSNHTVTVTPTVGIPVFTLGAVSTRCQGAGSVTYTATASNTTGITYTLDAASLAGGNSINAGSGAVTYVAGWSGTSVITASAAGCNGPATATHTVTVTPTVGLPVFALGATSTRCQGAGTTTYTATSTHTTGITYSLDAPSITAGNSINNATGAVTFVAGWTGVSTITASAAGCNGPRTATHTVTTTGSLGNPTFTLGASSVRSQGAGTTTYTATASNNTGITYSLDATSLAGGLTINASTGAVTFTAGWTGASVITVTATGCGGPKTTTHTVTTNASSVYKQLYLSDPAQSLDRVDPVNTADNTTANTVVLSSTGTTNTTFTMGTPLCSDLTIKAGTITVRTYLSNITGTMPGTPNITAVIRYGATTIITLTNPVYSGGNLLTWTATLGADVTVPAGQAIALQVTTAQAGVSFRIDYDSQTRPSRIDLPVSTFINMTSFNVYTAAYPGGTITSSGVGGTTKYIRAVVTDPFGFSDITGMNITITPPGTNVAASSVATSGCSRTYEYVWATPVTAGTYQLTGVTREGYENTVTFTRNIYYEVCSTCAPIANADSASGAGGSPIVVDVLANDTDPNNNMNNGSLTITAQPHNGSAFISNNTVIYLPNGTFSGHDTLTYQVCDFTAPTPLCSTAQVFFTIDPTIVDICGDAVKTHTYYIPYPEAQAYMALDSSGSPAMPGNNIRTVISLKIPYPGMRIVWDEWEDGYEANQLNPTQSTTKVWGDGDPYNGIAPGYSNDIIPAGGNIVLDNTMPANPRNSANIFYDGKDKITSNGQIAITQVSGEPSIMPVQAIKTNVTSVFDFGQSFTVPVGEDINSQDFSYTALFIRASQNNTVVNIDKDNNGTLETTTTLNEGESYLVNGSVLTGATVTSDKPIGVELHAGGYDNYSVRNAPIFPATWYSNTYYTPVPTSDIAGDNPKDSSVVMLYNSLNRDISINWSSGVPSSGSIMIPAKSAVRFPLAYSATAAYKFENPTGESFTAIEIIDSYTPGGGGNSGSTYDWSFNLISEQRLSDYATVAWAPGSLDLSRNDNPIWVTTTSNTTLYVKYDGDISNGPNTSPCGFKYDVAINLNALNYTKIKDNTDNDQGGVAVYTCNGAKIAAVYGEDPATAVAASPSWDVGSTIQPFCKQKLVIAADDYATTMTSQPVTIPVLLNDVGFLATIDPASVTTLGLLQPSHGTLTINTNGTILYTPANGYVGLDTFEYRVCSTPSPIVCDVALVVIRIDACPSNSNQNIIRGQVFTDINKDGVKNDDGSGFAGAKVYLYTDGNCNATINTNELIDSTTVDASGYYQFTEYPEKIVSDNFDGAGSARTCADGTDGNVGWAGNWTDSGDPSTGFCNTGQSAANTDAEIMKDGAFTFGLRLKDNNVSATRSVNLSGASKAFLTFSYRRKSTSLSSGESIAVQASSNGSSFTTIYTINGDGTADASYVTVYNQDISTYASANSAIRFLTNNSVDDADTVYIDDVSIRYLSYNKCYITQLATSSLPATYYASTTTQRNTTFTNGGACVSAFDFGVARNSITISGTLRNDGNGLNDGQVNGSGLGNPGGATVYAYLTDTTGRILFKTTVNAANGQFSFPNADVNTPYLLQLSVIDSLLFGNKPSSFGLTSTWGSTGDEYGTNNASGSGVEPGSPNVGVPITTGTSNVNNVNLGIQRVPTSDDHFSSINHPTLNSFLTLNGGVNPPVLSGADPEDYPAGGNLNNRTVYIDTVPDNAELYYNGVLVINGQTIPNFNPSLFQVKFTSATLGDSVITFRYSFVDQAGVKDPSPALYLMMWNIPLPANGLTAIANLQNNIATVKWSTLSEHNTEHFILERSVDNSTYTPIGNPIKAAGTSESKREYQYPDNISGLSQYPVIYYRVKLVDIDYKFKYSNVVAVRLAQKPGMSVWPNPFQSQFTISITTEKETTVEIQLYDMGGRMVRKSSQQVDKGTTRIPISGLDPLPAGIYMVEVNDTKNNTIYQKLLKKE